MATAPTLAQWRVAVEAELKGVPFEQALVHRTAEGLALQPLYTEASSDPGLPGEAPFVRGAIAPGAKAFDICMRVDPPHLRRPGALAEDLDGGADALWVSADDPEAIAAATAAGVALVVDGPERGTWDTRTTRISGVDFHDAGADAADELALMLAGTAQALRGSSGPDTLWFQISVGRDTFGEICKLRALRWLVGKVYAGVGAGSGADLPIHAVCSQRTQTLRDPWVNLLRVTTQIFAAAIGGAQLVTPRPFDDQFGVPSAHGRRVARNAALVLREESGLGRVIDAGGGSYYLETRTEQLAREAWRRFQQIESQGGLAKLLANGEVRAYLDRAWLARSSAIAKRKEPIVGVSAFANPGEELPGPLPRFAPPPAPPLLAHWRDSQGFEALRAPAEAFPAGVVLVTLGAPAEHRARVAFAQGCFATAGLATHEVGAIEAVKADIACICGTDERYASEAALLAKQLRVLGCRHVVVAGRPGRLEQELREAGVDAFLFVGCDLLETLAGLLS